MMARLRRRFKDRLKLLAVLGLTGLVVLLLMHRYPPASRTGNDLQAKMQKLRALSQRSVQQAKNASTAQKTGDPLATKAVLMHSFPYFYELKSGSGVFSGCEHPCILTLDPDMAEVVDCVVVYSHGFKAQVPKWRPWQQTWVFFAVESPINWRNSLFSQAGWMSTFNWTMTYRRDSDFYFGYGDVVKAQPPPPRRDLSATVAGKSKLVAWFVSNCHTQSKREDFVQALKQFLQVDVYGNCGPLKCSRSGQGECLNMLSKDYFFYLSFENSLCNDYLTEKVYHIMKTADVVPVVRGGSNYTRLLPENSFVDASQFPSVKALADHLRHIASNRTLYASYLAWKQDHRVIEPIPFSFCELCQRLHHTDRWARVYPDINAWWEKDQCHGPPPVVNS